MNYFFSDEQIHSTRKRCMTVCRKSLLLFLSPIIEKWWNKSENIEHYRIIVIGVRHVANFSFFFSLKRHFHFYHFHTLVTEFESKEKSLSRSFPFVAVPKTQKKTKPLKDIIHRQKWKFYNHLIIKHLRSESFNVQFTCFVWFLILCPSCNPRIKTQ